VQVEGRRPVNGIASELPMQTIGTFLCFFWRWKWMSLVIRLKVPVEMHYTVIPMGTSKVNSSHTKPNVQSNRKSLIAHSRHHQDNYKETTQGQLTQMSAGEFDWSWVFSLVFSVCTGKDKDSAQKFTVDSVECVGLGLHLIYLQTACCSRQSCCVVVLRATFVKFT